MGFKIKEVIINEALNFIRLQSSDYSSKYSGFIKRKSNLNFPYTSLKKDCHKMYFNGKLVMLFLSIT